MNFCKIRRDLPEVRAEAGRDVERKVAQFEEKFGKDIPQNWRDFLKSFKGRTEVLAPQQGFVVCDVVVSGELLELLARDAVLRKYVVKV